jgi:putative glycosyltransferase (TIGR04372 family)
MNIVARIMDFISLHSQYLILSPHYRSFGDSVEQIYFGLLYCYEKEKKLILVSPYQRLLLKRINIANIYLYQLEHELIHKPTLFLEFFMRSVMTFLVGIAFLNTKLRRILASVFNLSSEFYASIDQSYLSYPAFGRKFLYSFSENITYKKEKWFDLEDQFNQLTLPKELEDKCLKFLSSYVPESINKPWIVLHVLDSTKTNYARGANIASFLESIRYLTREGYHIFRIGDDSMPKVDEYGLTDLAHVNHEKFLDLYLIDKAKLFIGTQSGPAYVTNLFNTSLLTTNLIEWSTSIPRKKGDLFINKILYDKTTRQRLALSSLFSKDFNFQINVNDMSDRDVELKDNSSEDILEALKEQLTSIEEGVFMSDYQKDFLKVKETWLQKNLLENKNLKIHYAPTSHEEFTRIRSIALSSTQGLPSKSYMKRYWR